MRGSDCSTKWTMGKSECRSYLTSIVHASSQVLGIFLPSSSVAMQLQSRLRMIEAKLLSIAWLDERVGIMCNSASQCIGGENLIDVADFHFFTCGKASRLMDDNWTPWHCWNEEELWYSFLSLENLAKNLVSEEEVWCKIISLENLAKHNVNRLCLA